MMQRMLEDMLNNEVIGQKITSIKPASSENPLLFTVTLGNGSKANIELREPPPEEKEDLTLRELQTKLPWTIRYSQDFRASPLTHKDFAHAMHHVSKAAGKLHALADDCDHDRALADNKELRGQYGKYIADLVVCALRLANTFPGGVVDLQEEVRNRIETKNNVIL